MDEKLQDIISIVCLLETDMEFQRAEDVHFRTVKVIHRLLHDIIREKHTMRCK